MPSRRLVSIRLALVPAAALLVVAAVAERAGAVHAVFYLLLAGVPVGGVWALAALGRLVDAAEAAGPHALARLEAALAAVVLAAFVVGAGARSPVSLVAGAPGLAKFALVSGLAAVVLHGLASLVPIRR